MLEKLLKSGGRIVDVILILGAGKGERLAPETLLCPKPLLDLEDSTILERLLRQCKRYFTDIPVFVNFSYLPHTFLKGIEGLSPSIRPQLLYEETMLGPANTVKEFSKLFPEYEEILVIHGDIVVSNAGFEALSLHCAKNNSNFVVTHLRNSHLARSCVRSDSSSRVEEVLEIRPHHPNHPKHNDDTPLNTVCHSLSGIFCFKSELVRRYKIVTSEPISPGLLNFLATRFSLSSFSFSGWRFAIDSHQSWHLAKKAVIKDRLEEPIVQKEREV